MSNLHNDDKAQSPTPNLIPSSSGSDRIFPVRSAVTVSQDFPASATVASPAPPRISSPHLQSSYFPCTASIHTHPQSLPPNSHSTIPAPVFSRSHRPTFAPQTISQIAAEALETKSLHDDASSIHSTRSPYPTTTLANDYVTSRFKHVITDSGHAIITSRDGDALQRCEDEPIHIPGAVQSFGLLIALAEENGKFLVRVASENSQLIIGYTPHHLFTLDSFTDILTDEQADDFLDHVDFVRDPETDVERDGPELFTMTVKPHHGSPVKLWCAMHINPTHKNLIICEFELENDVRNPLAHPDDTPSIPEDILNCDPTVEDLNESTTNLSRPLRVLRSARKSRSEAAAMEVFNIMSQISKQLSEAPSLDIFLKVLVGVVKELSGFHRVMAYQFDKSFNGRVVTELVDPRATKDLYKGLHFPASDIPRQARELYKLNRVRMLYDRDQQTARLVCRTPDDLATPLDLTHSYLRAMSPIHLKYLANMAVRSSMSISINAFDELWGLISCHTYGPHGMRISFPIRKICRLVGDTASRNIERLSYAARLQARKLINTAPSHNNPSGYIIASSEDLLELFSADFSALCINNETRMLGTIDKVQETLAMLEYLKLKRISSVTHSQDVTLDFPDLQYAPGFHVMAGMLLVPLTPSGSDFIAFFRKCQLREVRWAGNPYEKTVRAGTTAYLEPRSSFKVWRETVFGKCREWSEADIETACTLSVVFGRFISVWRQKEAALQNSQLTKLLISNSAHQVRTPLNAIINYLEIALESPLDKETRENLTKSHSASKSLIYVLNDLLDLTKTEQGIEPVKSESIPLVSTINEAISLFTENAKRKGIEFITRLHHSLPDRVCGDQRVVRQAIANIIANAIAATEKGSVTVEAHISSVEAQIVSIEIIVEDTGIGMSTKELDSLFFCLEQIETTDSTESSLRSTQGTDKPRLGLGLAIVARTVRNMNGQLRVKSEENKGSRFVIVLPFELPSEDQATITMNSPVKTPPADTQTPPLLRPSSVVVPSTPEPNEVLLVNRSEATYSQSRTASPMKMTRGISANSTQGLQSPSIRSATGSMNSQLSNKSDVDRLIEAISGPQVGGDVGQTTSPRPPSNLSSIGNASDQVTGWVDGSRKGMQKPSTSDSSSIPGQYNIYGSANPITAIKVPEEDTIVDRKYASPGQITGEAVNGEPKPLTFNVLVAEDDPVNYRIINKRLTKLGHNTFLTVNGEECASLYQERQNHFDVVLMDIQMPIIDGLSATKMIRATEKKLGPSCLSDRAALNGRVPIIAVSASLLERDRNLYMDAGFDAWILKPVSFPRLKELFDGIVDASVRSAALYTPGEWERGGWFSLSGNTATVSNSSNIHSVALGSGSHGAGVPVADDASSSNDTVLLGQSGLESSKASQLALNGVGFASAHPAPGPPAGIEPVHKLVLEDGGKVRNGSSGGGAENGTISEPVVGESGQCTDKEHSENGNYGA